MTPANERKAKERQAKRDAGLVRVEVWVPRDMVEVVKQAVAGNLDQPLRTSCQTARNHLSYTMDAH